MNRMVSMIIFITIVSAVYFGLHFLVYKGLIRSIVLIPKWQKILKWFFWLSGASFMLSVLLSRMFKIYFLNVYATTWMGMIAISFFVFLIQLIYSKFLPSHTRVSAYIALAVIGIISLISLINGLQYPSVKNVSIPLKNLPKELSGFRIVQLSDLHLEAHNGLERMKAIIDKVNALKPDLVVITGDLIDGNVCDDPSFCEHIQRMKPPHGVLAITGNHEYYAGLDTFYELANRSNIKVLRNECVTIADSLQVIGLDDRESKRFDGDGPVLDRVIKNCDLSKPIILLYHRPLHFDEAVEKGVGLQLSGHTHAGQIPPMDLIVRLYYKYPHGLYKKNDAYIYTSPGTGVWGPHMRFLSRNEITLITLRQ
jgi:uncharacterized protein